MSYDLMVFDNNKAPRTREDFIRWFEEQSKWSEDHEYMNHNVTSPELKAWFLDMIKLFPQMNGEFAPSDETVDDWDENDPEKYSSMTDYSIGEEVIYCAFAWSVAENAYYTVKKLAKKHFVGFFDVSGTDGDIEYNDR